MSRNPTADFSNFFVAGINYKKTDTEIRGSFAIGPEQYDNILKLAAEYDVRDLFVLSTCNRSEIYGITDNPEQLVHLLCSQTQGSSELFNELAYRKNGLKALHHLFDVGAGLDSQILGDYEIIGQLRQAMKFAKGKRVYSYVYLKELLTRFYNLQKKLKIIPG